MLVIPELKRSGQRDDYKFKEWPGLHNEWLDNLTTIWDSVLQNKEHCQLSITHWNSGNVKDLSSRNLKI